MTIHKAIEKAIEGGYNYQKWWPEGIDALPYLGFMIDTMLLDPDFWQSLGKTMKWEEMFRIDITPDWAHDPLDHETKWITGTELEDGDYDDWIDESDGWKYHWHRFIDHLAEGKTVESFFGKLK